MYFTRNEEVRQKLFDYTDEGLITDNVIFELKSKPYLDINEKNLEHIFIVWDNYEENNPYIIECPVKSSTQRSYIINVKDRDRHGTCESYRELKISKREINKNIHYKASSTYEMAFTFLLMQEQGKILQALQDKNDIDLYKLFAEASKRNLFIALEIIAEELEMEYLFRLDDDTKLEKEN